MAPLHPVPLDKDTPFPVSPQRIYGCLEQMDLLVETIASDAVAGVVLDGLPFVVYLDADSRYLSIRCTWDTLEPYRQVLDCLFAVANSWNRERYFPTIYIVPTANDTAEVVVDFVAPIRAGLTDEQLTASLNVGFSTGADAMFYMQDSADSLLSMVGAVPGSCVTGVA